MTPIDSGAAPESDSAEKRLTKGGLTSIALGLIALLACELPILLAVVGLSSLSSAAAVLRPPFWAEVAAFIAVVFGSAVVIALVARRLRRRDGLADE